MKHASFAVRMLVFWTAAVALFAGCSDDENTDKVTPKPTLEEIILDKEAVTLDVGDRYTFEVTLLPEGIEDVVLTWSSSDPETVSVEEGTITALAYGEAVVTVSSGNVSASCRVTVDDGIVDVESVTLNTHNLDLKVGETYKLEAIVEPEDAVYELTWESSDDQIVKVSDTGSIEALAAGEATVTVTAGEYSDECVVVVTEVAVESITLNQTELELEEGGYSVLIATVKPDDATNKGVTWTSLDETVATVDQTGMVKALKAGNTTVRATAGDCTAECKVVVTAPETPPSTSSVNVGDYFYSDGTWSTELQEGKTVVGIVFHAGDATATDAALARDHGDCTHGLAVSLSEVTITWQSQAAQYGKTVSSWIEANAPDYEPILTSGTAANAGNLMGYNNTMALKAFNAAAENSAWPVESVDGLETFSASNAAPSSTSGWYIPSVREMSLLISGKVDGNFEEASSDDNRRAVNTVLETVGGTLIQGIFSIIPGVYQTSSEVDADNFYQVLTSTAQASASPKTEALKLRPILAF